MNAEAITLLLGLLNRAAAVGALLSQAALEGRDVTSAELDALLVADDAARTGLANAIAAAKAGQSKLPGV